MDKESGQLSPHVKAFLRKRLMRMEAAHAGMAEELRLAGVGPATQAHALYRKFTASLEALRSRLASHGSQ